MKVATIAPNWMMTVYAVMALSSTGKPKSFSATVR